MSATEIRETLDAISSAPADQLPVLVKTNDRVRMLGHASDHDHAQALAHAARIAHGRTSLAQLSGDERRFFLVRP